MKTPTMYSRRCELGGEEIDIRQDGVFQFTEGWVMSRTGGGGHGVSLPKRHDRWACRYHIERESKGYTRQETLFG